MRITFLGTGGGRTNLVTQKRRTGGIRVDMENASIHIDPGPGALLNSVIAGLDPRKLDAIICTHFHVDHYSDAEALVEAISIGKGKKKGIFIGSEYCVNGEKGSRAMSGYFFSLLKTAIVPEFGKKTKVKVENGSFSFKAVKIKHDEPTAFGVVIEDGRGRIGYTSDTEYYEGLGKEFGGCDLLIADCIAPVFKAKVEDHMNITELIKLAKEAEPKNILLHHMGVGFKNGLEERIAKSIEEKTGIKTEPSRDFMVVEI